MDFGVFDLSGPLFIMVAWKRKEKSGHDMKKSYAFKTNPIWAGRNLGVKNFSPSPFARQASLLVLSCVLHLDLPLL